MLKNLSLWTTIRKPVFSRFFISYLILILVPTLAAVFLINGYFTQIIDHAEEEKNGMYLKHQAKLTDDSLNALRTNMYFLITSPRMNLLKEYLSNPQSVGSYDREEMIKEIRRQLTTQFESLPYIERSFLYFPAYGIVLDSENMADESYYFAYVHRLQLPNLTPDMRTYLTQLQQNQFSIMPHVATSHKYPTGEQTGISDYVTAVSGHPSRQPDVYLFVNMNEVRLLEQALPTINPSAATLLIDDKGNVMGGRQWQEFGQKLHAQANRSEGSFILREATKPMYVSYVSSDAYSWKYLSLTDLHILRRPVEIVRIISIVFLGLFVISGVIISYMFSRRMYSPIQTIMKRMELWQPAPQNHERHDELELIHKHSEKLISSNKDMSGRIKEMRPLIQEQFLNQVLSGQFRDSLSIRMYADEIELQLPNDGPFVTMAIELQYDSSETGKAYLLANIAEAFKRPFKQSIWVTRYRENLLACIVQSRSDGKEEASRMFELLQSFPLHYGVIAVGASVEFAEQLHHSYASALQVLDSKKPVAGIHILTEEHIEAHSLQTADQYLSADEVKAIHNVFHTGDAHLLETAVWGIIDNRYKNGASVNQLASIGEDILNSLIRFKASESTMDLQWKRYSDLFQELQASAYTMEATKSLFHNICHLFAAPAPQFEDKRGIMKEVQAYIDEHYSEELSLDILATKYQMSLGYFSRLFKDTVGDKYVDYVAKRRIEAAKALLLETDKKLEDISAEVGFIGKNTFTTLFKKYEGLTPGKYRETFKQSRK